MLLVRVLPLVVLLAVAARVHAQNPDPVQLVKDAAAYLSSLPAVGFSMEIATHLEAGGEVRDMTLNADILFGPERRSELKIKTTTDAADVLSDGKHQYIYRPKDNTFLKVDAPLDREDTLSMVAGGPMQLASIWLGRLLNNSLDLVKDAQGEYVGLVGGEHHIKLTYPKLSMEVYLGGEGTPLPKRIVMDVTPGLGPAGASAKAINTITLSNIQTAPEAGPERFAWQAPEGAKQEQVETKAPGSELLGKVAPAFELNLLAGGNMALANHKDKDVVVLDFFATWCGPCRMSMPIVNEVANEYKDKGVATYAVNCGEDADRVEKFMAGQKLTLNVAMDTTQKVQRLYGANSIPRMVVIGKDGTVQAIHAGFSPALGKELREQLDTLLAGKRLEE